MTDLITECKSAHHLVLALFACEAGLGGAGLLDREGMYRTVVEGLASVKNRIMSDAEWSDTGAIRVPGFEGVAVSRWEDAQLFRLICRRFADPECEELQEDDKVEPAIYPLVGSLMRRSPEIWSALEAAVRREAETGRGRKRVEKAMAVFGLRSRIDLDARPASMVT
jgi:hypothetical protein